LALLLTVPISLVLYNAGYLIDIMKMDPILQDITIRYLFAILAAVPAFLLFQALRNYVEGLSLTKPAMVIGFIGLIVNIPLNWIFVYGKLGLPAMGGAGCGVATTIVYWVMLLTLIIYVLHAKKLRHYPLFRAFAAINWKTQLSIFKLGLPVAVALFFEITIFAMVALLIAPLGASVVAAHQIAINFSSMVFMLPMSIANGVSIRVGFNLGRANSIQAKNASYAGFAVGLSLSVLTAFLTLIFREEIALLYTDDKEVVLLAVTLILFSAMYQCIDAIQVIAAGALRGYKEMMAIFASTFVAYWLVGLPLGYSLAMTDILLPALGAKGFWIGITAGLSVAAILLGKRLYIVQKSQ
ncbi:MAG TPA: MATE family efflux transporter, partial [Psychromonas sp.]